MSLSFSGWPTFTHTWLITDLLSDKDSLSFSLFWGNKFFYLLVYCYYFYRFPIPMCCQCNVTVCLLNCCDSTKLWTATTADMLLSLVDCVGGLWCNLLPQGGQPKSKKWHRVYLNWQQASRKTHDGRPQEIRHAITAICSGSPLSSITNYSLFKCFQWPATLQQGRHTFHFKYNYFQLN